jgi:hypothetical protein
LTTLTFSPGLTIYDTESISLADTNCVPALSACYTIAKVISDTSIQINAGIQTDGTQGTMTLHSNYESVLGNEIGDVLDGATDALGTFIEQLISSIWSNLSQYSLYIYIFIGILLLLYVVLPLFNQLRKVFGK